MSGTSLTGQRVVSRNGDLVGRATGGVKRCQMDGCSGRRVAVRWPPISVEEKGKLTWPCTKGMEIVKSGKWKGALKII